ncbi:hypothetical protein [Microbacterium lacus]|uniref:hypothetical protein n=1 Tax=Microbacterium lacus TaxID=415217 RepID=UPI000C2C7246|nr:hypothetical protein [Microbacterium lacus]
MRILTVQNPWAHAIIHGGKDVENRGRSLGGYRGPVAIHAGLTKADAADTPQWELLMDIWRREGDDYQLHFGAIIGVVELVAAHHVTTSSLPGKVGAPVCWDNATPTGQLCSKWAESFDDGWHLELANARPLREPILFKGALGLRGLDEQTITAIEAAL